jgi:hypothetical protein
MAANAANDSSGRCQPKFIDEYREMVIRKHPMLQKGQVQLEVELRPSIGYMRIIIKTDTHTKTRRTFQKTLTVFKF